MKNTNSTPSPFDFLEKFRTRQSEAKTKNPDSASAAASASDSGASPFDIESMAEQLRAPGVLLIALEGRAPWELGATLAAWPFLKSAPQGDGHPVIVFPGLGAGDFSTAPLRSFKGARLSNLRLGFGFQFWSA